MTDAPHSLTGKNSFMTAFNLCREAFRQWLDDKAPQLGAALAYYRLLARAADSRSPRRARTDLSQ